jgi:TolA-binding protein
MAKRIIIISLFPICAAFVLIALVLADIGRGQLTTAPVDIGQTKSQVISLINNGNLSDANSLVVQIMALPANTDKGIALQQIAGAYQNAGQADKAISISGYVLQNWPKESFAVWAGMSMAISQIDKGNTTDSEATITRMLSDYADNADLPTVLCVIADTYSWRKKFDRAENLYGIITNQFPNTPSASKAKIAIVAVNALSLIEDKKTSLAKEQMQLMITDFNDQPDLYPILFRIGQEFSWRHSFNEAQIAFDEIAAKTQDTSLSKQAKLWSARSGICSLISKSNDSAIIASIDKLLNDFAGDSGLPEAVYWISKEYEWKKGKTLNRSDWYSSPNSVYQTIMQQFGNSPYGAQAELDQKRLSYRMQIFKLMQEPNQIATDAAIEALVADFNGRPELPGELYWIACGYEEKPDKLQQAKQMYAQIIRECPNTTESSNAVLDVRRLDIWDALNAGDVNASQILMDNFIADFGQNLYAGDCLGRVMINAYKGGMELKKDNQADKAEQYFLGAEDVFQRMAANNLQDGSDAVYIYYYAACNQQQLKQWNNALKNYQKVVDNWPEFEQDQNIQSKIALCYEKLVSSGQILEEQANPLIEQSYRDIINKYPYSSLSTDALFKLGWINFNKGQWNETVSYFERGLNAISDANSYPIDVMYALGRIYDQTGNNQKAIDIYQRILSMMGDSNPEYQIINNYLTLIKSNLAE